MSGPKVVRVVTREEQVSQCQLLLARLDQSVALWKEACESIGQVDQSELDKVISRRNDLESLFRSDQFQNFTRDANDEIAFLESDVDRRKALYFEAKAREAARRESALQTARTLLSALKASDAVIDEGLLKSLELAKSGTLGREEVDKLLAQGFKLLAPAEEKGLSQSQRDLAKRMAAAMGTESPEQWTAPGSQPDMRSEAVARGIAELSLHGQPSLIAEFEKRLETVRAILDGGQRNLRLDSLNIEVNDARLRAIRVSSLVKDIKLLDAELAAFGGETEELRNKLRESLDSKSPEEMEVAHEAARVDLSNMEKQKAASERRHAVLHGLAKLGYSVNEGMSTALSSGGRVVVQKPDFPGYGVELLGGTDSERLQVRTVALAAVRDKARDVDAERRWCSDFTKLRTNLGTTGTQLVIERAVDVGVVPLRVVESSAIDSDDNLASQKNTKNSSSRSN